MKLKRFKKKVVPSASSLSSSGNISSDRPRHLFQEEKGRTISLADDVQFHYSTWNRMNRHEQKNNNAEKEERKVRFIVNNGPHHKDRVNTQADNDEDGSYFDDHEARDEGDNSEVPYDVVVVNKNNKGVIRNDGEYLLALVWDSLVSLLQCKCHINDEGVAVAVENDRSNEAVVDVIESNFQTLDEVDENVILDDVIEKTGSSMNGATALCAEPNSTKGHESYHKFKESGQDLTDIESTAIHEKEEKEKAGQVPQEEDDGRKDDESNRATKIIKDIRPVSCVQEEYVNDVHCSSRNSTSTNGVEEEPIEDDHSNGTNGSDVRTESSRSLRRRLLRRPGSRLSSRSRSTSTYSSCTTTTLSSSRSSDTSSDAKEQESMEESISFSSSRSNKNEDTEVPHSYYDASSNNSAEMRSHGDPLFDEDVQDDSEGGYEIKVTILGGDDDDDDDGGDDDEDDDDDDDEFTRYTSTGSEAKKQQNKINRHFQRTVTKRRSFLSRHNSGSSRTLRKNNNLQVLYEV